MAAGSRPGLHAAGRRVDAEPRNRTLDGTKLI